MRERITVILGAGAMIEATGVSTSSLTQEVIEKCKEFKINKQSTKSIVDVICDKFLEIYNKEDGVLDERLGKIEKITKIISFEDIFHVLELIPNYINNSGHKGHTSAFKIFSQINNEFRDLDKKSVYASKRKIIELINDRIYSYDSCFLENGEIFKNFFIKICGSKNYLFDVFNLNYDTWMEQTLEDYNDGYIDIDGYEDIMKRFDINEYLKNDNRHTISHLHGQICFEYPDFKKEDRNRYAYIYDINTLYKYKNFNLAKDYRSRSGRSDDKTQSGENLFRTNIVTGLMKTDKILWTPLNSYQNKLTNCLMNNKKLIIIGYGFSDLYINQMLWQYNTKHLNDRKILMIDYISDDMWNPAISHPFKPEDKALFTNIIHKDDSWCRRPPFKPKEDIMISEDNMVCICTSGFNSALNYIEKIKNFLK